MFSLRPGGNPSETCSRSVQAGAEDVNADRYRVSIGDWALLARVRAMRVRGPSDRYLSDSGRAQVQRGLRGRG
jgi:hypothetical protein